MKEYGYWDKKTRAIFGPGHFEMSSAKYPLTAFYTKPVYEGQEPFACVSGKPGVFIYHTDYIGQYDLVPVYEGKEVIAV